MCVYIYIFIHEIKLPLLSRPSERCTIMARCSTRLKIQRQWPTYISKMLDSETQKEPDVITNTCL